MEIIDSFLESNSAEESGGILYNPSGNYDITIKLNNSKFIKNTASVGGIIASINAYPLNLEIDHCEFDQNKARDHSSAVVVSDEANGYDRTNRTKVSITDSIFTNNSAYRATIFIGEFTVANFKNCTFIDNKVSVRGGVIYNYFSRFTLNNSKFINNIQTDTEGDDTGGGAIYQYGYRSTVDNCDFVNNTALGKVGGGSIYKDPYGASLNVLNSNFINTSPKDFMLVKSDDNYIIQLNDTGNMIPKTSNLVLFLDDKKMGEYVLEEGIIKENGVIKNFTLPKGKHEIGIIMYNNTTSFYNNKYILPYELYPLSTVTNIKVINDTIRNTVINVTVSDETGTPIDEGLIYVTDNDGNYLAMGPIINNQTIIKLDLDAGEHQIIAKYAGNETHTTSNNTTSIKILHDTNIDIEIINNTEGNVSAIITVTDENKKPVKQQDINITLPNGTETTKKTDDEGKIQINDNQSPQGQTKISANITGNNEYQDANSTKQFTILPDYQKIIDELNETVQEQNKTIQNQSGVIDDLNKTVQDQDKTIDDLNKTVQDQDKTIDDLNKTIQSQDKTIDDLNKTVNNLEDKIEELEEIIESLNKTTLIRAVPEDNTVGNTKVVVVLDNKLENPIANATITVKNKAGETIGTGVTDEKGTVLIPLNTLPGTENITAIFAGNNKYAANNTTVTITTYKINTTVTVDAVNGVIGESIKLTAHIKDANNNLVSGGNLVFKLNGKTLRTDGSFNSTAPAWKFKVNNGLVTITINADLYLRNAKNLTASYSGSYKYNEAKSDVVTAQIKKRDAKIAVTATPSKQKQYKTITFTAKLSDTTPNYKNKTMMHTGTKVLFKVNGKTIKDKNGANLLVKVNSNNTASYKYTVPQGMGGVTNDGKVRDYNVEAVLVSDIYYPDTRGTTTFNVERSPITIGISKVTVNSKNQLSVQASIKDYKNNYVIGTNNVNIKINGRSYVNAKTNKTQNFKVSGGKINLSKLQINKDIKIKSVMIVTGARQAYLGQRNETSKIVKV